MRRPQPLRVIVTSPLRQGFISVGVGLLVFGATGDGFEGYLGACITYCILLGIAAFIQGRPVT